MVVDFDDDGDGPGDTFTPINNQVDYFNVSPVDDNILYYDRDLQGTNFSFAGMRSHDAGQPADWWQPYTIYPEDIVGNPDDCGCSPFPHTPDDPDDMDFGTPLYAHRNTAEWLP
jgi:hypothetical protein